MSTEGRSRNGAGGASGGGVHPIEAESYRLLGERVDLRDWPPGAAAVAARVVHATADPSLVGSLVVEEEAVAAGVAAMAAGAPVLCDVQMVAAGIAGTEPVCLLSEATEAGAHPSRTAAAMATAAERHPEGAVVVVGCAPTALHEVNARLADGRLRPALVVGVPVGYVGAAESKEELLEAGRRAGVPVITLRGERGGAAVAAAAVNAIARLAGRHRPEPAAASAGERDLDTGAATRAPAMVLIGHGTRSAEGRDELRRFAAAVAAARPGVRVEPGFIEFVEPDLDQALDALAASGASEVIAVPLVLLGAGHLKDDGPAALAAARRRHPGISFSYARDLGVHPSVLAAVGRRAAEAAATFPHGDAEAVVVVGRGSTDPDANADLAKAARLLADGRGLGAGAGLFEEGAGDTAAGAPPLGLVVPAFVSLARPGVASALDQCAALGAKRIAVAPYFLFAGLLVERIAEQALGWAGAHPGHQVAVGAPIGVDRELVELVWDRFDEARAGPVHMNCDGCLYRAPLPGYEHRVGAAPFGPPPLGVTK